MEALYLLAIVAGAMLDWQLLRVLYARRSQMVGLALILLTVVTALACDRLATALEKSLIQIRQPERITSR